MKDSCGVRFFYLPKYLLSTDKLAYVFWWACHEIKIGGHHQHQIGETTLDGV